VLGGLPTALGVKILLSPSKSHPWFRATDYINRRRKKKKGEQGRRKKKKSRKNNLNSCVHSTAESCVKPSTSAVDWTEIVE
jgi:hypothetical protein